MQPIRKIYQDAPDSIAIPEELRHQAVEVIIWPLSEQTGQSEETDANGWPIGFFEETFGSLPDLPDREWQGDYEEREPLA
ncbi:hypothetical protein [Methylotuvimicrobium sp. KM2]|uniref:hypothetical protein n=1 Tax=Methylotuvimicrobium sp. KM2 TaxID=3133976 RepID=UPI0031018738